MGAKCLDQHPREQISLAHPLLLPSIRWTREGKIKWVIVHSSVAGVGGGRSWKGGQAAWYRNDFHLKHPFELHLKYWQALWWPIPPWFVNLWLEGLNYFMFIHAWRLVGTQELFHSPPSLPFISHAYSMSRCYQTWTQERRRRQVRWLSELPRSHNRYHSTWSLLDLELKQFEGQLFQRPWAVWNKLTGSLCHHA